MQAITATNNKHLKFICLAALLLSLSAKLPASEHRIGEVWLDKCARCHGDTGDGNTPLGKKLKVADYRSKAEQGKFTDDYLHNLISEGKIVGDKLVMPSFKDDLSSNEIHELATYIRKLAK